MSDKPKWEITLYDGTRELFTTEVRCGRITEKQLKTLLKTLVAKAGLDYDEIPDCYTRQNVKRHAHDLDISVESKGARYIVACGTSSPRAVAVVKRALAGRHANSSIARRRRRR